MTIAELIVNIAVKGSEKAIQGLGKVKEGLGNIADSSLMAKAAVLGVVYGLEQLTMLSSHTGMELKKFGDFTKLSTDDLQRWQFVLRQTGVSSETTASTIKSLQSSIAQMQQGKGPPGGLNLIAQYTGGLEKDKVNDTFYMMEKMRQFFKNPLVPPAMANEIGKAMGLSEDAIQGFRTMSMNVKDVKPSFIYTDEEIQRLARVQVQWDNLFEEIKMFGVRLGGSFGNEAVSALTDAFHLLTDVSKAVGKLLEQFPALKVIVMGVGVAIAAVFAPITTAIAAVIFGLSEIQKYREGKTTMTETFLKTNGAGIKKNIDSIMGTNMGKVLGAASPIGGLMNLASAGLSRFAPAAGAGAAAGGPQVNQVNNFHGVDMKDAHQIETAQKKANRDTFRQSSAQSRVN
jgi:hypothetical protein